jgi:hypothetical protein
VVHDSDDLAPLCRVLGSQQLRPPIETQVQELAKGAARRTLKSVHRRQNALAIKRQRGLEGRSAAGLEAQPTKAPRAGLVYDVLPVEPRPPAGGGSAGCALT